MTKFIIRDGNKLFLKERTHSDNMFLGSSFRETDLHTKLKPDSIKKIFENPITAIAYDTTHNQHNIEMDKKSLTKALDFWINDKVLQNEKILFIEGKLDDVHEIELKNLIELREFVQKQDNDTVFTRFRGSDGSSKKYDFTKKSSWGVEFFVKRELAPNNITYNYRDLFMGDGARWDFGGLNSDDISFQLFGARHNTDPGTAIANSFSTAANHASEALNDLSRALSRSNGAGTNTGGGRWIRQNQFDPTNYRIVPDIIPNAWKVVAGHDGTNIAVGFNSETDAQRFVDEHISNTTNRTFTLPAGTNTNGPDHLLHSNLHPGITSPPTPQSNRIQDITFENLTIHPLPQTFEAGSNSYTMATYTAQNGQYEMDFQLYVTGREIDRISEGFRTHTMRILEEEEGRIEIDGQRFYCANYTIRERIINVGESFVPRSFHDMYIHSVESSISETSIGGSWTRWEHKLVLRSADNKIELELSLRDSTNTFQSVIQRLRRQAVNIGILTDRTITINGYSYRNEDPPEVTYSSR